MIDNSCLLKFVRSFKNSFSCLIDSLIILFNLFRQTLLPAFEETVIATIILFILLSEERRMAFSFLSVEIMVLPFLYTAPMSLLPFSLSKNLSFFVNVSERYYSSLTVNFFLPLDRRLESTILPFLVFILSRKPCLFFLFVLLG